MTRYERYDISASPGNKHLSLWRSPWWAADDHGPEGLAGVTYICSRRRHCGAQVSRVQCHCVSSGWSNCEWALRCKWVSEQQRLRTEIILTSTSQKTAPKRYYIIPFKQERDGVGSDWLHWPHFKTANTKWQCDGFIQKGFFDSRLSQSGWFLCPYNIVVEWIFLVFVLLCGGLN